MGRKKLDEKEKIKQIHPGVEGWRIDQLGGKEQCELICVDHLKRLTKKRVRF
jgi:hypothetical protein